jgi:arsenate reductase
MNRLSNKKLLFLCIGNSARSQMAEGFLRHLGSDRWEANSAGIEPRSLNLLAVEVMREKGIDISQQYAKGLDAINLEEMDIVITLCEEAEQRCPVLPVKAKKFHWFLPDPAKAQGSEEEKLDKFRKVRDEIEIQVKKLIEQI